MNILICGSTGGSFRVRGQQLGAALGARVVTKPTDHDLRIADLVVLVKRAGVEWAAEVHKYRKPIVWDALDFWFQPSDNDFSESDARSLLRQQLEQIKPALFIGATEAMADDAAKEGVSAAYLPHHSRPGLIPGPAVARVPVVGYEGAKKYLGGWFLAVQAECDRRGWPFVVNSPDLRACDILVAFRDGQWDGWMCRQWKSGIKAVNAIASGRPLIAQASAGVVEISPNCIVVEEYAQLPDALETYASYLERVRVSEYSEGVAKDYTLRAVAERYAKILKRVVEKAA